MPRRFWLRALVVVALWLPGPGCGRTGAGEALGPEAWRTVLHAAAERVPRAAFSQLRADSLSSGTVHVAPLALRAAVTRLEQEFLARRSPDAAGRAAVAHVVSGRPGACLDALALIPEDARTADVWADQSACELEQAIPTQSGLGLARALEAALRGLALEPRHDVALRNRSLSLRALGLTPPAPTEQIVPFAFLSREHATRDEFPRGEDRRREDRLEDATRGWCDPREPITAIDADLGREVLMRCVLRRWAEHALSTEWTQAGALASHAARLAAGIEPHVGDACLARLVEDVTVCGSPDACRRQALGWLATAKAATAWDAGHPDLSLQQELLLREAYPRVDSLAAAYAWLQLFELERLQGRARMAETRAATVRRFSVRHPCGHVRGRAAWRLLLVHLERQDVKAALEQADDAVAALSVSGDREALGVVLGLQSLARLDIDAWEEAWASARAALSHTWEARTLRRESILTAVARTALRTGLPHVATLLLQESARGAASPSSRAFALFEHSRVLSESGWTELADAARVSAEQAFEEIEDPGTRGLVDVYRELSLTERLQPGEAAAAELRLRRVIAAQARRGMTFQLPALHAALARAVALQDRHQEAHQILYEGVALATRPDGTSPATLVQRQALVASVAEALWRTGQDASTFALLRRFFPEPVAPVDSRALVLRFVESPSHIFVIGKGPSGPIQYVVERATRDVAGNVRHLRDLLARERGPEQILTYLSRLFEDLLGPVRADIVDARHLVVWPGRLLAQVPFAALHDRTTARHVVEFAAVQYRSAASPHDGRRASSALIVQPAGREEAGAADGTSTLLQAAREASSIARIYGARSALESDVSPTSLARRMAGVSVLHFAGHAVVNSEHPELSRLVLGAQGDMTAADVARLDLSQLQLVFLSACSTASRVGSDRFGSEGLSDAFLRAGAAAVVGTLWDVSDGPTRGISVRFHQEWTGGRPPADALRVAQREALQSARSRPWEWAGFVIAGRAMGKRTEAHGHDT